ncbi:PH domain-containing protein [Clostridium sp.]|uniref:PH domain-containing protein n=1 Tax=Clostridium sp. TaxID=1506 RepID=UPI0035A1101B
MKKLNKIERNHILRLFYDFINTAKNFIPLTIILMGLLLTKVKLIKSIFILSILIIFILLCELLAWKKNFFIVKTNSIYHEEGVFSIKKIEIPLDRINTIDISQKLLERIFKAATIKIDTGDSSTRGSELKFTLSKNRAESLRNILLKNQECDSQKTHHNQYTIDTKHLFIYSLISNSLFKGLGMLFVAQQFFQDYLKSFINLNTSKYINELEKNNIYSSIMIIIFLLFILIFVSIFLSIIYNIVKYYNFKLWTDYKNIYVNYGITNRKNYSFDKTKIKGIHIKQSILMQHFKFFTLEIENIGYGDEKGEKAILYPICSDYLKKDILKNILGEFKYTGEVTRPENHTYFRFLCKKFILWIIIAVICFFIKAVFVLPSLILLLFLFVMGHLEFKNTAFGMNENILYMCHGSFNKTQSLVKIKALQSLTLSHSYFQHNKGICNYSVVLQSSTLGKTLRVKNLKNNIAKEPFN